MPPEHACIVLQQVEQYTAGHNCRWCTGLADKKGLLLHSWLKAHQDLVAGHTDFADCLETPPMSQIYDRVGSSENREVLFWRCTHLLLCVAPD